MKSNLEDVVFVIPSLDPDEKMPEYVGELIELGAKHILLVDDGSSNENQKHFDNAKKHKEVICLKHEVNKGKGRALKTAFGYVLDNMPNVVGVVTADADGQHAADDTIACVNRMLEENAIVLGTRNFNEDIVPFKSRNGNKITTFVFGLLYGKRINDTQTGLRAIPRSYLPRCISMHGERFEYEISMLIDMVQTKQKIVEEPIKTIYYNSNRATHFNTLKDSFRIYKIILGTFIKFALSSFSSFLIDISIYTILKTFVFNDPNFSKGILFSTVIARICSTLFNYTINRNKVFSKDNKVKFSIVKYYILACSIMLTSWLLVSFVYSKVHFNTSIIKIFVDLMLFFVNFQVQRRWVFKEKEQ